MSEAQFRAIARTKRQELAGSGTLLKGNQNWVHNSVNSATFPENRLNQFWMGTNNDSDIMLFNGVELKLKGTAKDGTYANVIHFSDAPDT